MHDLIIIGAGPAGLSAAIYAARKKIKTLLITGETGGQTSQAYLVENYLGFEQISGLELADKFFAHAKKTGVKIKEGTEIKKIEQKDAIFEVIADQNVFSAKSVIVATGKKYRELEVPGADKFKGKGITYCATCDAPLFKNKTVAVVGAGDSGQDTALQLTQYAAKIYLLNKYPEMRGDNRQIQDSLKNHPRIEIFNNYVPIEIKGEKFVEKLIFKHRETNQTKEITVDGIFVEIGSVPTSKFLANMVNLNKKGEIVINPKTNMTSRPGIFAAGDITDAPYKQMIIAAGEGAKAALSVYEYLKLQNI